jgi:hypothetical protein
MDIAPLPNKKKTINPAMNKRGKMHSEVVTFTPKKIMVEERREKQLIAQNNKRSTREGKAEETERKGATKTKTTKEKKNLSQKHSFRKFFRK